MSRGFFLSVFVFILHLKLVVSNDEAPGGSCGGAPTAAVTGRGVVQREADVASFIIGAIRIGARR